MPNMGKEEDEEVVVFVILWSLMLKAKDKYFIEEHFWFERVKIVFLRLKRAFFFSSRMLKMEITKEFWPAIDKYFQVRDSQTGICSHILTNYKRWTVWIENRSVFSLLWYEDHYLGNMCSLKWPPVSIMIPMWSLNIHWYFIFTYSRMI